MITENTTLKAANAVNHGQSKAYDSESPTACFRLASTAYINTFFFIEIQRKLMKLIC